MPELDQVRTLREASEIPGEHLDAYVHCKTWGHSWSPWSPPADREPEYGIREYVRCDRCATERFAIFSPFTGEPIDYFRYRHPKDYKLAFSVSRRQWRVEAYRRALHIAKTRRKARKAT